MLTALARRLPLTGAATRVAMNPALPSLSTSSLPALLGAGTPSGSRAASSPASPAALPPLSELLPIRTAALPRKKPRQAITPPTGPVAPLVATHTVVRSSFSLEHDFNKVTSPASPPEGGLGLEGAPIELTGAGDRLFAVINLGGTQYKVTPGDVINAESMKEYSPGDVITLGPESIAAVGGAGMTVLGRPAVPRAEVRLVVKEQALDKKIIIFKKQRRKHYVRRAGHRRRVTILEVLEVTAPMDTY